jgi:predicted nucleic acid-binding protein
MWIERQGRAVTSTITMTELLVHPYRESDIDRVNSIYALTSTFPNLSWVPVTLALADNAARLRAKYSLRTPDAIHLATAIAGSATGFIGNDHVFQRVTELEILLLDTVAPMHAATGLPSKQSATLRQERSSRGIKNPQANG